MPAIRGITVSVGQWYADILRITLWRNLRHLTSCVVVTAPGDPSVEVARGVPGVRVFETDAFYRPDIHGNRPMFAKGLAMEEGLTFLGRQGLILIWDADILFPPSIPFDHLRPNTLHGARRRVMEDPSKWHDGLADPATWLQFPRTNDGAPIGYFQLFAAEDPALRGKSHWYDVSYPHAGGCDDRFLRLWKDAGRPVRMLPIDVLHLGPVDRHWHGTTPEALDVQARYVTEYELRRGIKNFGPEAARRAGELPPRLEYPGYEPSTHLMPFEKRALDRRARQARG